MINSNVFFYEEKTFFFGTLVPQQYPDGIYEKFKIINPNKVDQNLNFLNEENLLISNGKKLTKLID